VSEFENLPAEAVAERLCADLEEIRKDLLQLQADREVWRDVTGAVKDVNDPETSGYWLSHYSNVYVASQIMAVRRTIRGNAEQVSLARVLSGLARRPDVVTVEYQERLVERTGVDAGVGEYLIRNFITEFSNGSGQLDPEVPLRDQSRLFEGAPASVIDWADRMIAHRYPLNAEPPPAPLFRDIDESIEIAREIYQKYRALLTGVYDAIEHLGLPLGWHRAFERPLYEPDF